MWLSIGLLVFSIWCLAQIDGLGWNAWFCVVILGLNTAITILFIPFAFAKTRPHHLYYGFYMDGFLILPGFVVGAYSMWTLIRG